MLYSQHYPSGHHRLLEPQSFGRSAVIHIHAPYEQIGRGRLVQWTELQHAAAVILSRERLEQLLARADTIVADLQQGKGTVGKLLIDPSAAEELQIVLGKANRSMDELQVALKDLRHASSNLQLASTKLPAISDAIGNEAKDLPGLILQTQMSMRELERLVEAMQRHWLLRRYVNRTNPPPLLRPLPSGEPQKQPVTALRSPRDTKR